MTNDELLALYLDNTLSGIEREEFERRLQTSPEFVSEARELSALQSMLVMPLPDDEATTAFLRNMEQHLAAGLIAGGAAAATGAAMSALGGAKSVVTASSVAAGSSIAGATSALSGGAVAAGGIGASTLATSAAATTGAASIWTSLLTSLSSGVVGISIGAATVIGGGAATYYAVTSSNSVSDSAPANAQMQERHNDKTSLPSASSPHDTPHSSSEAPTFESLSQDPSALRENIPSTETASNTVSPASPTSSILATPSPSATSAREYSARISGGAANSRYAASALEYTRQLQEKEAAGDRLGVALIEKSLGALLRQAGDRKESRRHLQNALTMAQELSMKELEGETRGELALLHMSEGKPAQAEQMLHEAIQILTAIQSPSIERWQKELEKITSHK